MNLIQIVRSFFATKHVEVTGRWEGYYGYGPQYSKRVQKRTVGFTARIVDKNGVIGGMIREDETGIPEITNIVGQIKGIELSFTKTYHNCYQIDEHEQIYVSDGMHHVKYLGFYDASSNKFQGRWKIESVHVLENGKERKYESNGYWEMWRVTN